MQATPFVPVIDLFAGPGGLGEGFSSLRSKPYFQLGLSVEKDPFAHQTLLLRSFFRKFDRRETPPAYYEHLENPEALPLNDLMGEFPAERARAMAEAIRVELGPENNSREHIEVLIRKALGESINKAWVLIGGPPCQAYSLIGRARMRGRDQDEFERDHRHYLYREYLHILKTFRPPVFVMENVKGILSSTISGNRIFEKICSDLENPALSLANLHSTDRKNEKEYFIFSLAHKASTIATGQLFGDLEPEAYIVKSENYGIPQTRHRVILLGIRKDLVRAIKDVPHMLQPSASSLLREVLCDMPPLRSGISREKDSADRWLAVFRNMQQSKWLKNGSGEDYGVSKQLQQILGKIECPASGKGENFVRGNGKPSAHANWYLDHRLKGVLQHQARTHMPTDLERYIFASCFAEIRGFSPKLKDFPRELLPNHSNVDEAVRGHMFNDRFRVQLRNQPSSTITCHIAKDGHYYIHPDPLQCRSLTVREAARLQTFPDNYFFEGPRTEQYKQVGNAVPPLLANKIARIVHNILEQAGAIRG